MNEHPVEKAAALLGGYKALADRLGVSKSAVHQWKAEGRQVPPEHCPEIERLTLGAVRCEELNDKVDWAFVRRAGSQIPPYDEESVGGVPSPPK
ncbi:transcriptional regulator [Cupriavidus taiwanensis]|uniref:transcriptional regulator n=1 Tax=Cupriavidus taiwanensis TaxID=164546 RepID=UPI0039C20165